MRAIAVIPALCAIGALVLSLLCMFAGSDRTFLQDAQLLTVSDDPIPSQISPTCLRDGRSLYVPQIKGTLIDPLCS